MQIGIREKRAIVVAGVVVIAYLVYAFILSPTLERQKGLREELEAGRLLLKKYQATAGRRNQILGELNQAKGKLAEFESRLLSADKPPLAASQLQQIINDAARKVAIDIRSVTILGAKEEGLYLGIPISLAFVGNSAKLKALLQEIEGNRLFLQVSELTVEVINPEMENNIQASMVISGFMKKVG